MPFFVATTTFTLNQCSVNINKSCWRHPAAWKAATCIMQESSQIYWLQITSRRLFLLCKSRTRQERSNETCTEH